MAIKMIIGNLIFAALVAVYYMMNKSIGKDSIVEGIVLIAATYLCGTFVGYSLRSAPPVRSGRAIGRSIVPAPDVSAFDQITE